jgi:hypothetical protein
VALPASHGDIDILRIDFDSIPAPPGFAVSDPDWQSKNGHYLVRIDNEWVEAPDDAVITEPNRVGRTMVWPIKGSLGISIRCFMPGSMT